MLAIVELIFLVGGVLLIGIGFGDWYLAAGIAMLAIYSK